MKQYYKLYIFGFLCLSQFAFVNGVFSDQELSCSYASEIKECFEKNKQGANREIQDYICPNTQDIEQIAYQIIIDKKFKEIDERLDKYLFDLEKSKNSFFGDSVHGNLIDGVNEINDVLGKNGQFWNEYTGICGQNKPYDGKVVEDVLGCFGKTSHQEASEYFLGHGSHCLSLVEQKLSIAEKVGYNILVLNKAQVRRDEKKLFMQQQRSQYDHLIDIMNINIGYLERIWMKVPKKLRNVI